MNPLILVEIVKQLGSFGGSFRKEAVGIGTLVPAIVSIAHTCAVSCSEVSIDQWGFLAGSLVATFVVLNAKRLEQ